MATFTMTESEMDQATRVLLHGLIEKAEGRKGWSLDSVTIKGDRMTVRYTDFLAAFGHHVSPDLNREPKVYTKTFRRPAKGAAAD